MCPTMRPGDLLLIRHHPTRIRPGQVVVATFGDGTVAIKRAVEPRSTSSGADGWWLLSDNPAAGIDSRHRGPVASTSIRAVAIARLWPHPRLFF